MHEPRLVSITNISYFHYCSDENQDKEAAIEYIDEWTKNGLNLKTMCRDSYLENFRANAPICTPFNTLQDLLDCFETIENQKDGQTDGTGTLLRMWLRPERKFQVADDGSLQVLAPENAAWEDVSFVQTDILFFRSRATSSD